MDVEVRRDSDHAAVVISDRGLGIPQGDLPHLFERFYRGDLARTHGDGFGLGLSIAAWVAESHGGTVAATSRAGGGSTFTIRLPAAVEGP